MRELRVALLGQGFMGKAHSNAFAQVGHFYDTPFRIRRTLLCGRDAASLAAMAQRWEWEETTTDWRTAIDRKDIDIVDVALPNHLHAEVAIASPSSRGAASRGSSRDAAVSGVARTAPRTRPDLRSERR